MLKRKNRVALALLLLAFAVMTLGFAVAGGSPGGLLQAVWFGGTQGTTLALLVMTLVIFLFGGRAGNPRLAGGVVAALGALIGGAALLAQPDNEFLIPFLKNAGYGAALALFAVAAYLGTRPTATPAQEG